MSRAANQPRHPVRTYRATVGSRGQIAIPAPLCRSLGSRPGDRLLVTAYDDRFQVRRLGARERAGRDVPFRARRANSDLDAITAEDVAA